ncbi:hypothetical protein ACLKA6_017751 [Drosophila palustris]
MVVGPNVGPTSNEERAGLPEQSLMSRAAIFCKQQRHLVQDVVLHHVWSVLSVWATSALTPLLSALYHYNR